MTPLKKEFTKHEGFLFQMIEKSNKGYMYKVTQTTYGATSVHYEVFEHRENEYYQTVTYPGNEAFGVWAWCIRQKERAIKKFRGL